MVFTTTMVGSKKFHDIQAFPLDPNDYALLRKQARKEAINIYLRLFFEGKFRTVVLIESPRNLQEIWKVFQQVHQPVNENIETALVDRVHHAFVVQPTFHNIAMAKLSIKILCLLNRPELRALTEAPRANIVGVIYEFKQNKLRDYCYIQFALDDIAGLTATLH